MLHCNMGYGTCFWSKHLCRKVQKADICVFSGKEHEGDRQEKNVQETDSKMHLPRRRELALLPRHIVSPLPEEVPDTVAAT